MAETTITRRGKFKLKVRDPETGKEVTNTAIYNVMDNSRKLANKRLISKTPAGSDALDNSLAVLHAFDISVVEETQNLDYSLVEGDGLDIQSLETIEKTQDFNPNRLRVEKLSKVKGNKIRLSKIFKQSESNPINEPDTCKADALKVPPKSISNVIEMTDDFLNFSSTPITIRTLK